MLQSLRNVLRSKNGRIIFSIIWGLGLASLFRRVCRGRDCVIYRAPSPSDVEGKTYKFDNKCYQYKAKPVDCNGHEKDADPPEEFRCEV